MKKISHIIAIVVLVVLLLALGTLVAGAVAKANLARKYPAPGQLVDVGGYKMHTTARARGAPPSFWRLVRPISLRPGHMSNPKSPNSPVSVPMTAPVWGGVKPARFPARLARP